MSVSRARRTSVSSATRLRCMPAEAASGVWLPGGGTRYGPGGIASAPGGDQGVQPAQDASHESSSIGSCHIGSLRIVTRLFLGETMQAQRRLPAAETGPGRVQHHEEREARRAGRDARGPFRRRQLTCSTCESITRIRISPASSTTPITCAISSAAGPICLRLAGVDQSRLYREGEGLAFVVRRMEIDFRKPALMDDLVRVETRLVAVKGSLAHDGAATRSTAARRARIG